MDRSKNYFDQITSAAPITGNGRGGLGNVIVFFKLLPVIAAMHNIPYTSIHLYSIYYLYVSYTDMIHPSKITIFFIKIL